MRTLVILLTLVSCQLFAQTSNKTKLISVEVSDTFFTIYSEDGDFGKQQCDAGNPIAFYQEDFPNNYDAMLSVALTAFASEKPVTMWFAGCRASPWTGTLPKPSTIVIHKQ